ncbi:MAG: hypothetical protein ACRYE9_02400 [Janthinobacterium lividum]
MFVTKAVSKDGREQAIYIKKFQDASLAGKPFCGCIINLAQDNEDSFYQISGINEGPQVIGQALEEYF